MGRPHISKSQRPGSPANATRTIESELGKIFYKWNLETKKFDTIRLAKIIENDGEKVVIAYNLDDRMHFNLETKQLLNKEAIKDIYANWTLLKSEGIINAITGNIAGIVDAYLVFFPKDPISGMSYYTKPKVVARQAFKDVFSDVEKLGICVTEDTTGENIPLMSLLECDKINHMDIFNYYKTDSIDDINILATSEEIETAFQTLKENVEVNGIKGSLKEFLESVSFIEDVRREVGITQLPFSLKDKESFTEEEKMYISTLYGNIKIERAIIVPFDYTYDLTRIKMRFMVSFDSNDNCYLIGYTENANQYTEEELKSISVDLQNYIHNKLMNYVKVYEDAEKDPSKT